MIEVCCEYLSVRCIWMYVIITPRTSFRVNLNSLVCLNFKESPAWRRSHVWNLSKSNEIRTHNHLVRNLPNDWGLLWVLIYIVHLTTTYLMSRRRFTVNPRPVFLLNVKEPLDRSRCHIWSLSNSNEIGTTTT